MKNELARKRNALKDAKKIEKISGEKIKKGLANPNASTGTPISELRGGAKFMAQLSNIGGGSKATGGNGIAEGFNTIMQNQNAKTLIKSLSQLKQGKTKLLVDKRKKK